VNKEKPVDFEKRLRIVMGFKEILQEPCVMIKDGMIVFFYVDDIVFAYRKKNEKEAVSAKKELRALKSQTLEI
jgi:hypothetical protein